MLDLADVHTNSRGLVCRLRYVDGCDVDYVSSTDGGLAVPFGISFFDESPAITRVILDVWLDCEHGLA